MVAAGFIIGFISLYLLKFRIILCHLQPPCEVADAQRDFPRMSLKNNEIESLEVAKLGGIFIATFLHTRSFNILRRLGRGVKRKTSENQ